MTALLGSRSRWGDGPVKMNRLLDRTLASTPELEAPAVLEPRLAELARSPLIEFKGGIVLERLIKRGMRDPSPDDLTGFEALTNKT